MFDWVALLIVEGTMKNLLIITIVFLFHFQSDSKILDVNDLNKSFLDSTHLNSIKEKPQWKAKDNWLNDLSKEELKKMLGAEAPNTDVEFIHSSKELAMALPVSIDWRNKDGKNWVSPIMNQGSCGSCVAFASIGTLETQINISSFLSNLNLQLSPQHLFSCGGGACSFGWMPESAAKFLKKKGVVDESCMPYSSGVTGEDVSCQSSCSDSPKRVLRITDYHRPTQFFKSPSSVKKALLSGPLVTTMKVYEDFLVYSQGIYKHASGGALGGHAVSLIGYDDAKGAFIIRNSWGESWGEKGFAYIDYDDSSGIGNATWSYEVDNGMKMISIEYPRNNDFVSDSVEFSSLSNQNDIQNVVYSLSDKSGKIVNQLKTTEKSLAVSIDSSTLPDGKYDVISRAYNIMNQLIVTSKPKYFYVVNHNPELKISFKGYHVDLSKDIKGRIEFQVFTESNSVPMNTLEFHFKDESGNETVRATDFVVDEMRLGWKTGQLKNGKYSIWLVGKVNTKKIKAQVKTEPLTVTLNN